MADSREIDPQADNPQPANPKDKTKRPSQGGAPTVLVPAGDIGKPTDKAPDGQHVTLKSALVTELPPMLLVGLNFCATDVPEGANWDLAKGYYKFTHRASDQTSGDLKINEDPANGPIVHDFRKPSFIRSVLDWVWKRLDIGVEFSPPNGPSFGAIKEAWTWQWPIIFAWQADPMGVEEQWAQCFSELFDGIAYWSHANAYKFNMAELNGEWDEYVFSRLQSRFLQHAKGPDGKGRAINSWKDIDSKTIPEIKSRDDYRNRPLVDNDDPAAPIVSTCNFIATYVVTTRGFPIESAKNKNTPDSCSGGFTVGLSAGPADQVPAFTWHWFDSRGQQPPVIDYAKPGTNPNVTMDSKGGAAKEAGDGDMAKDEPKKPALLPALLPGSVCTYHPYHKVAYHALTLPRGLTPSEFNNAAYQIATATAGELSNLEGAKQKWVDANPQKPPSPSESPADQKAHSQSETSGTITGQPNGCHINAIFRVHKSGERIQLYQAGAGEFSEPDIINEGVLKHIAYVPNRCALSEGAAEDKLGLTVNGQSNGVGLAKPPPDLAREVAVLKKARPIGMSRLVLTLRKSAPEKITETDVLFVSRIQQMYGRKEHQNFSPARLMWSLRNTPGFTDIQAWWIIYYPLGKLAKAMWAHGSREMKLEHFVKEHQPDGLAFSVDYCESQVVTNNAEPCGTVSRYCELASNPPKGDPNAGATSIEERPRPPPNFMRTGRLPVPPRKDGLPDSKNILLPYTWAKKNPFSANDAFPWNATYIRKDIASDGAIPPEFAEEW